MVPQKPPFSAGTCLDIDKFYSPAVRHSKCSLCLARYLHFAIELVASRSSHENVDDGQVVVDWSDHKGVARPDDSSRKNRELLVR